MQQLIVVVLFAIPFVLGATYNVLPNNFVQVNEKAVAGDVLNFLGGNYKYNGEFVIRDNVTYKSSSLAKILGFNWVSVDYLNSTLITGFQFYDVSIFINNLINDSVPLGPTNINIVSNSFQNSCIKMNANGAHIESNKFSQIPNLYSIYSMQCANCYVLYNSFDDVLAQPITIVNRVNPGVIVVSNNCIYNTTFPNLAAPATTIYVESLRNDTLVTITNNVMYDLLKTGSGYVLGVYVGGRAVISHNYMNGGSTNGAVMQFIGFPLRAQRSFAYFEVNNNTAGTDFWPSLFSCINFKHGKISGNSFYNKQNEISCEGAQFVDNIVSTDTNQMPPVPACPQILP